MKRLALVILVLLLTASSGQGAIIAEHMSVVKFDSIPDTVFQDIRSNYSFFYGHTSHGSQIITGMEMLSSEDETLYSLPYFREWNWDLGTEGYLGWVDETTDWLAEHPETNVVMWSWCSGGSINTVEGIDIYLNAMNQLEMDYPDIKFIYMTGHVDGTGDDGTLRRNNDQIRAYCLANDKILFDFADIESTDPDGTFYPDEEDDCFWCIDWCATHECPTCVECAHSHCFNCYRKGKAFWWMMARIEGVIITPVEAPSFGSFKSLFH